MKNLVLRSTLNRNLSATEVDTNFTDVKTAVDAVETAVRNFTILVGASPDSDAIVNTINELLTMAANFPESVNLYVTLNNLQRQIDAFVQAGPGGIVSEANLSASLLSKLNAPVFSLPLAGGLVGTTDADGRLISLDTNKQDIRDIVRDELSVLGGLAVWAKPTLTPFDDTDILSLSSPGAMEYCLGGDLATLGDIGQAAGDHYAGSYSMGNFDRPLGYVWVRTKKTSDKAESGWVKSPAFNAAVGQSSPNLLPASEFIDQRPPWSGYNTGFYNGMQTDPLGGQTMFQMTSPFSSECRLVSPDYHLVIGETYTLSAYFQAVKDDLPYVPDFTLQTGGSKATIQLANGGGFSNVEQAVLHTTDQAPQGPTWTDYVLVEMTFVASNSIQHFDMVVNAPNATRTRIWRPQVNAGPRRTTYQPTVMS